MAGKTCKNATAKKCGSNITIDTSSTRWSEQLPEEIMHLVLQRLCISDYLRCREVCPSWREAVRSAIASKRYRPAPELAWLVPCGNHVFNLSDQNIVKGRLKSRLCRAMVWQVCVGSIEGWLIMVRKICRQSQNVRLLNPISGARVMLPPRSSRFLYFTKVVASTVPTSPQCIVACICSREKVAFCRPFDKSWTVIDEGVENSFEDIEIIDGKLYATNNRFMMMFDIIITQDANGSSLVSYKAERLVTLHPSPYCSRVKDICRGKLRYYLAKDSTLNELYMIFVENSVAYSEGAARMKFEEPPYTQGFQVFKLEDGAQWVEVVDLGARILFLSKESNAFIHVNSNSNSSSERNCIFFAFNDPIHPLLACSNRDVEVFSLTNKTIQPYNTSPLANLSFRQRAKWFTPNPW